MHHPLVPLVVLVLLPLLLLAGRQGTPSRVATALLTGCAALILTAAIAAGGVDFEYVNRMKMLVAAAVIVVVLGRRYRIAGLDRRRPYLVVLAAIAVPAWVIYLNFFSFHGTGQTRVFLHLHDVAHYYLGSKYYEELGYTGLYTAMLRAEAEMYDDHFRGIEARDLETKGLYHIRVLLERSGPVKARFTPARWHDFQLDVAYFREALGPQYADVLRDHGFNATPVWALIGGTLTNLVPAGSHRGILLIALLDPAIEALTFASVAWAFGSEAALLAMIYFCVVFGASFGWTGGGHLRYLWLFGLVGSVCCAQRGRHATAGALLALAACLRVFPVFFAVGPACKAVAEVVGRRTIPRCALRFFAGLLLGGIILGGATLLRPNGWRHWAGFTANMRGHVRVEATNLVGLNAIVAWNGPAFPGNEAEAAAAAAREARLYRVQLLAILPLVLLFVALRSRREDDVGAMVLGSLLAFAGLGLASYYYVFLVVYLLARPLPARRVLLLFGCEVATYVLALFEDREVVLYLYRSLLVAGLLAALHGGALKEEARRVRAGLRRARSGKLAAEQR
jgi:hypothetical protein